jgi:hypothetical protein
MNISEFFTNVKPQLVLLAQGIDRVAGRPVDQRGPAPVNPTWTDEDKLNQVLSEVRGLVSYVQSIPTPVKPVVVPVPPISSGSARPTIFTR